MMSAGCEPIDLFSPESVSLYAGGKLLRYASQNSLDESSQKQIPKGNHKEKSPYKNQYHCQKALEVLDVMRRSKILCDVVLTANGTEVAAHRTVLAGCSPYFYAMFTKFEERKQDRIEIKEIDSFALELLIEYVYTAEILVTEENVQTLLPAANLLQLSAVRDACCDFLESQLHPTNCLGIRAFADLHSCMNLLSAADTYIEEHFSEVVESEEFLSLPFSQVVQIIKSDKLIVPDEEEVFECVINWVQQDVENRQSYLPSLMEHVRLSLTSIEYLREKVNEEPLLKSHLQCKDYIIEALMFHCLKPNERASIKTVRTKPRQSHNLKALLVIGGQAPKAIRSVEFYDLKEQKWYGASDMPSRRCRAGLVLLDNKVYVVGGFNGSLRVKTVDVYDIQTDQWTAGVSMEARRSTLGVAVLNSKIYAVGGFDGSIGLETAEVFDPETQLWSAIAPMSTRRSSVGVGVLNNLLYAVGGYDGNSRQCLNTVEYYNPETNTWHPVAEMTCKRSGAGVGIMDGILYAVGGHDGPDVRDTVETYDPNTGVWKPIAKMAFCRRNAGVVSYNGSLYVVGGDDGLTNLASVEMYCAKNNTWTVLPKSMDIGRSYAGVTLIDRPPNL